MTKPSIVALLGGGIFVAALLGVLLFMSGGGASATKPQAALAAAEGQAAAEAARPAKISSAEAEAWGEARAAGTASAYKVYLAAFPEGAFAAEAKSEVDRLAAERAPTKAAAPVRVVERAAPREPSRAQIAASCRAYVDEKLSQPSKVARTVGGAAGGCAVGLLAGGDDGRNCAIGAVAGGVTGAVTAENRERRRMREVEYCIANGGPPRG